MCCTVDKKLWKYLFLGLPILVLPTLGFKIKDLETRTVQLFLRNNGELEDTSQIPNCGPANKIVLNSFAYDHLQCSRIACSSVYKEALSKATAFHLHQNCSFRQKCQNLHFPVRNVTSGLYAVTIQYQCIDEGSLIVNMCEQHELNFNGTLHLLYKNYSQNFKNCECWVNKGPFSTIIMDLRLNSRHEDKCSTSKLVINVHHFKCDARSDSYGAIFGEALQDDLPIGAFISLVHNSDIIPPGMVWLALIPEGVSRLVCYGNRITSQGSSNMATTPTPRRQSVPISSVQGMTSTTRPPNLTTKDALSVDDTKDQEDGTLIGVIVILTTLMLGVVICIAIYVLRKKCVKSCFESTVVLTPEEIRKHSTGSTIDTVENLLSDKTLKSDCYKKKGTDVPVQESEQDGRDDPAEENPHTYALLNHFSSKNSGIGVNENEIYHNTQFKKLSPQRDPTYNHIPADRRSVTNYDPHNKFLKSQI